jgi:transcriptional regulator with XRE-family HTH domain
MAPMPPRPKLKMALVATGKTQRKIAAAGGINERRLSDFVTGWASPTSAEARTLSRILGKSIRELFCEQVARPARRRTSEREGTAA